MIYVKADVIIAVAQIIKPTRTRRRVGNGIASPNPEPLSIVSNPSILLALKCSTGCRRTRRQFPEVGRSGVGDDVQGLRIVSTRWSGR